MPEPTPIPTVAERIAARRLRGRIRHAHALGAGGGTLLAALAAVAFATAEDPVAPASSEAGAALAGTTGITGPTGPDGAEASDATTPVEAPATDEPTAEEPDPAGEPDPAPDPAEPDPTPAPDGGGEGGEPEAPADESPATGAESEPAQTPAAPATPPVPTAPSPSPEAPALTAGEFPAATAPARARKRPRRSFTIKVDQVYVADPMEVQGESPRRFRRPATRTAPAPTPRVEATPSPALPPPATPGDDGVSPPPSAAAVPWSELTGFAPPLLSSDETASFAGPRALLPIYLAASLEHDVPWELLAAINEVETNFGRNVAVSSAGAVGWMQFMPATWASYGEDGDGDGVRDPDNPVDAIFAAAAYLSASGAPKDLDKAVFAYNHSRAYVADVLGKASGFAGIDPTVLASLTETGLREARAMPQLKRQRGLLAKDATTKSIGRLALLDDRALGREVMELADVYPCGREDIEAGVVDRRVLLTLALLATKDLRPTVSSLQCGHGLRTSSGNISEHTTGTAVDIAAINGVPVMGHQGPGTDTGRVVRRVARLRGALAAHQIISLMTLAGAPNTVSMADHADHVHIGFRPAPRAGEDT